MAIAWRPATPAPITNTCAGGTVPAAVVSIGNIFGSRSAAIRTALYPTTVAWDDSTSMLCARVIRGMKSRANAKILASAAWLTPTGHTRQSAMPTMTWSGCIRSTSSRPFSRLAPQVRTWAITSAS